MGRQRRFMAVMAALATACAVLQAVSGDAQLVLHLTPLFLIAGLLLAGRYVGEERIVALWRGDARPSGRTHRTQRWLRRIERPVASLLERSPRLLRGPPVALAAAA